MAATHGLYEPIHRHPFLGTIGMLTLVGLALATLGLLGFSTSPPEAASPTVQQAAPAEGGEPETPKKWVWKKRVSRDNPVYAFGER